MKRIVAAISFYILLASCSQQKKKQEVNPYPNGTPDEIMKIVYDSTKGMDPEMEYDSALEDVPHIGHDSMMKPESRHRQKK